MKIGRWHGPTSLSGRFLLAISLWVLLGISGIWLSSTRLFSQHVEAQFHDELLVHVRELGGLTSLDAAGRPYMQRPLSDPRYAEPLSGFYWQVSRPDFGTLKSPSMTLGELDDTVAHQPQIIHRLSNGPTGPTIVYGFLRDVPGGPPLHFTIATDERHLTDVVASFTRELTLWLLILALALFVSGLAIVTLGFRPLGRLSAAVDDLRRGTSQEIRGQYPDELQPLVDDLNRYVQRSHEIIARARVEAGALAHSLRTPLTIITDEAEQLKDAAAGKLLLVQCARMQHQIDYHLARSRSGGSRLGLVQQTPLADILTPVLAAMRRCHPGKEFITRFASDQPLLVAMDADDLGEVLTNLLDNAGKWATKRIEIDFKTDASGQHIRITDDGPGIAEADWAPLLSVGATLGEGPVGTGLGLPVARDLARDYGGDIRRLDHLGGLSIELYLPR